MEYSAYYTDEAIQSIIESVSSDRVLTHIEHLRELLQTTPELGRVYDPEYPASRPPFECRVIAVPDSPFSLYYVVDEDAQEVIIFHIENQRMDPTERFAYHVMNW